MSREMISYVNLSEVAVAGMPGFIPSVVPVAVSSAPMPHQTPELAHAAHAAAGWPAAAAIALQPKRRRTAAATATRASVDRSPF